MKMYYMTPPFGSRKNDTGDVDIASIVAKVLLKVEKAKKKEEEAKKKGEGDKKKDGGGPTAFQLMIFFTAITPFVGPASVWATSFMMRQAFENLQAIVH